MESNSTCNYTLSSLTLFWLAESVQWIFDISAHNVITADNTIITSRTLKVTGNHVKFARFSCVASCLGGSKSMTDIIFVQCIIKQLLDSVFFNIQNNQSQGKGYQPLKRESDLLITSMITDFIEAILKSLIILAMWLALSGAIYSRIALSFALNRIFFSANENGTVKQNNQSDLRLFQTN